LPRVADGISVDIDVGKWVEKKAGAGKPLPIDTLTQTPHERCWTAATTGKRETYAKVFHIIFTVFFLEGAQSIAQEHWERNHYRLATSMLQTFNFKHLELKTARSM
jgi:hypothetical protein